MIMIPSLCRINLATFTHDYKRVVGMQMIMIPSLFRINLATFTHDYKRVVDTDDHDPLLVQDQPGHLYPRLQEGGGYR
jgi:hypothetical protein